MDEFTAVSRARDSWNLFAEAMNKGRDILQRAGIAQSPPPVPEFEAVYRRLTPALKKTLFTELESLETISTADALRIWQPLLKQAAPR